MANRYAGKSKPVRKSVGFSHEEWREVSKWIAAQRPKISESEGLRQLVFVGRIRVKQLVSRQESERATK